MPDAEASGQQEQAASQTQTPDEFQELLARKGFKVRGDDKKERVKECVQTLAVQALQGAVTISDDAIKTIEAIIAAIDEKLSEQVNLILHHEDFKTLEGSWRGLHHLVNNTETDEKLKIKVFNISRKEVTKTLKKFKGVAWDQSPLFKKLYEEEFGTPNGEPFGAIVGDYYFDNSPQSVEILKGMGQIAAAAHAPFIAGADPAVMNMESWQDLNKPRDLTKIFQTPDYAQWRSLRQSEDSRYVGLAMPRFLSRLPYGAETEPVEEFDFEEEAEGGDHSKYVWSNSAYAMATNITRAFKLFGWCACIRGRESGGVVEGLPVHTFPSMDGGKQMKCPTEISIPDRREAELAKNGFMPLCHWKNTDYSVFIGAQSLQKPQEYEDPDATANANLAARLPYLFATCRFAHYLKCMVRDKIGSFTNRDEMEIWLNKWINQYCCDGSASQVMKAKHPLEEAQVVVEEIKENPGEYSAKFYLKPHYQLEKLTVSLRLVSKLPSKKE